MENRLVTSEELRGYSEKLPEGVAVVAFNIVNLSPKALAEADHTGSKICEIVEKQTYFFIISDVPESLRQTMHDYVDRFCDAREGK